MSGESVEVTVRFAKGGFTELAEVWAFIMAHVDKVGPDPTIEVSPTWSVPVMPDQYANEDSQQIRTFDVIIQGSKYVEAEIDMELS